MHCHGLVCRPNSLNACITPVLSCDGWSITTIEGLSNEQNSCLGLNPVQERLAAFHGSQCGFCTPGMVMQMNSYLDSTSGNANQSERKVSDIEDLLDGYKKRTNFGQENPHASGILLNYQFSILSSIFNSRNDERMLQERVNVQTSGSNTLICSQ